MQKPLLVIVGPTATGKSRIASMLAEYLRTEILTADSRQVFRRMNIGTAKPTDETVPRHLIDLIDPDERFSAGEFKRRAEAILDRLHGEGRLPIVEGGTGLYIRALLNGLWEGPPADSETRRRLAAEERASPGNLHRRLGEVDPSSAARIHPNDLPKIIRALEVFQLTGETISEHQARHLFMERRYSVLKLGVIRARTDLYRRIDERIDRQIKAGMVDEVRLLLRDGYNAQLPSMLGLGYRQLSAYLMGKQSYDEAIDHFKRETRRYAKRQLTWFRPDPEIQWIDLDEAEESENAYRRILALKSFQNMV